MSPLNSVRRDEILSRDSTSRSPSPQPDSSFQDAHQRLGALLNLDALIAPAESTAPTPALKEDGHQQEDEEQEFEFRLFSAPAAPKSTTKDEEAPATEGGETAVSRGTQKLRIRLRSPTPGVVDGEGRFLNPFRGWQYYFTTPELLSDSGAKQDPASASTNRRKQFEEVAVTGQQMLRWSEVSWVCVGLFLVSLGFDIVCLFFVSRSPGAIYHGGLYTSSGNIPSYLLHLPIQLRSRLFALRTLRQETQSLERSPARSDVSSCGSEKRRQRKRSRGRPRSEIARTGRGKSNGDKRHEN